MAINIQASHGLGSFIFGYSGSVILNQWPYILISLILAIGLVLLQAPWSPNLADFAGEIFKAVTKLGPLNWVLFAGPILLFSYYYLAGYFVLFINTFSPIWIFGHIGLMGAIFLSGAPKISSRNSLLASFSIYGLVLWIVYFIPDVHTYPLSMGWSEANRYYYASLFFSPLIYGKWLPLSSLHPSRYLMQSLPFVIPSLPILFHRIWQVMLWLGTTFVAGLALSRRFKLTNRWIGLGLAAWFFLFSFQGPVYYHLMVVIIIVLAGFDKGQLWRSLGVVALASLWAGVSRVNWFPVAGMLAVALYVLEVPQDKKSFWQYWRWPILAVVLGVLLAFFSQASYAAISGNPPEVFASSFNSPLYRYRLFPNEAFGPGIINMTITASFPLLLVIVWRLFPMLGAWKHLRLLALLSILIALLVVGFIVSMKIGGGDNLHNLDSYLVILAVVTAYLGFNRFVPDSPEKLSHRPLPISMVLIAFLIPLIFVLDMLRPYPRLDTQRAWSDIQHIQSLIDERVGEGGEVLFIDQRHLLTFDMIDGVPLVPEYEKVFLMEMAMSGNAVYLNQFWQDLEKHRFALIVSDPINLMTRPSTDVFGEENNVWVERVARPLTDSYDAILDLHESGISVLVPNQ